MGTESELGRTRSSRFTASDFAPAVTEQDVIDAVKGVRDEVRRMVEAAKAELSIALAKIVADQIRAKLDAAMAEVRKSSEAERKSLKDAMASFERTVKALPRPEVTVNVPQGKAPEVSVNVPQQKAPEVTVNVPQIKAPDVTVNVPKLEQPTVQVNVPKQDLPEVRVNVEAPQVTVGAPVVNVAAAEVKIPEIKVPELKQPEIRVEVPRRKVTKKITYDADGRPQTIEEVEE